MKKSKIIFFAVFSILLFSCKPKQVTEKGEYIISGSDELNLPSQKELLKKTKKDSDSKNKNKIDLDLTKMSATMIYAEVFNMLIMPEDYEEKNIKIRGYFQVFTDEYTGERYYAVIIPDATACCQQGLEFIWDGEHSYPDDYPQIGDEITITGRFKVAYTADDLMYTFLLVDNLYL